MENLIVEEGKKVKAKQQSWKQACDNLKAKTGETLTPNAMEKRFSKLMKNTTLVQKNVETGFMEKETYNPDGSVDAEMIVNLSPEQKQNQATVLFEMGYNPQNWEVINITFSTWQQHTKEQTTKKLYAIKCKLKPKTYEPTKEEYIEMIRKLVASEIQPYNIPKREKINGLNEKLLLFLPPLELHYGKVGFEEISQEYNTKVAQERFYHVHDEVLAEQEYRKCGTLYYPIGNDLFNSDTVGNTTTYGTQMTNDTHWKLMFQDAYEMHVKVLLLMREKFNRIDVECLQGNHDTMASFYLVETLKARFHDDNIIKFSDNLKKTTAYLFGENLILMNHGSSKGVQNIIDNVPIVFKDLWSKATFVFFYFGHEHHMEVRKEKFGILKEKLSSLSGTDEYHEDNGFNTSMQQQQFFIYHETLGRIAELCVNFPKKKLTKTLERVIK